MLIKTHLKEILKEQRYSIQNVADATGLNRSVISGIINNRFNGIAYSTLEKLCSFLKCKVGDIIEYIEDTVA